MACQETSALHHVAAEPAAPPPVPADEGSIVRAVLIAVPISILMWCGVVVAAQQLRHLF